MTPYIALFIGGARRRPRRARLHAGQPRKDRQPDPGSHALGRLRCLHSRHNCDRGRDAVWLNHTSNLWGVQVWWDLLFALGVAVFLVLPRARAQGMKVPLWILFVVATASIGLLAMVARLFWLESRTTS